MVVFQDSFFKSPLCDYKMYLEKLRDKIIEISTSKYQDKCHLLSKAFPTLTFLETGFPGSFLWAPKVFPPSTTTLTTGTIMQFNVHMCVPSLPQPPGPQDSISTEDRSTGVPPRRSAMTSGWELQKNYFPK